MRTKTAGELGRAFRALGPRARVRVVVRMPGLGIEVEDYLFEVSESATEPEVVARVRPSDLLGARELEGVRRLLARHGEVARDGRG